MISAWVIWVLAGLVLLGLEVVTPGVFLMWIGLAAIGAGLVILATEIAFAPQVVVFAALAGSLVFIGLRLRRPADRLNTQTSGLAGRTATALVFTGREGRVRVGDSDWAARVPRDVPPPDPGTRLRVEGVEGTVLIVRPET